ncbi:hypothetical protein VNO80_15232 [Phaseolus coccineus]|uniref:Pentatricopeptide repeat-containing protein n=1 Tax=Phaseolus coccineus TaxID=3886 RepID=A0AAN9R1N0_PHACN
MKLSGVSFDVVTLLGFCWLVQTLEHKEWFVRYARCGNLTQARRSFYCLGEKSVVSWTAIIDGYGIHGHGAIAIELFDEMVKSGVRPNQTVFVSVLSPCPEQYSCAVELLGRAGRLEEAVDLIMSMKVKPDGAIWGALLGACKIHENVKVAELAFQHVVEVEPMNKGYYVLLSNIYIDANNLDGFLRFRI